MRLRDMDNISFYDFLCFNYYYFQVRSPTSVIRQAVRRPSTHCTDYAPTNVCTRATYSTAISKSAKKASLHAATWRNIFVSTHKNDRFSALKVTAINRSSPHIIWKHISALTQGRNHSLVRKQAAREHSHQNMVCFLYSLHVYITNVIRNL